MIELALLSGIFILPYLVLRRDTSFYLQRIYLLAVPFLCLLSFLLPDMIQVESESLYYVLLPQVDVDSGVSASSAFPFLSILWIFISIGLITYWLFSIVRVVKLKKGATRSVTASSGAVLYYSSEVSSPCSFLNSIFLPTDAAISEMIIRHEEIHVEKKHTIDLIYFEILSRIFWFNPVFWWINKEIRKVHEFEVDQKICREKDAKDYRIVLLETTLATNGFPFVHGFKSSLIKNRLHMLKNQKRFSGYLKAGLILPFLAITIIGFSGRKELSNISSTQQDFGWSEMGAPKEPDNYPEFEGGMDGMIKFISGNLMYPSTAKESGKSGKVIVQFVVTKKGKVTKAKVLKGFDTDCDAEALRVVKSMPDWKPGTKDGKPVNVEMVLPIQFALN